MSIKHHDVEKAELAIALSGVISILKTIKRAAPFLLHSDYWAALDKAEEIYRCHGKKAIREEVV